METLMPYSFWRVGGAAFITVFFLPRDVIPTVTGGHLLMVARLQHADGGDLTASERLVVFTLADAARTPVQEHATDGFDSGGAVERASERVREAVAAKQQD
jgi:hypothetical protein